MRLKSTFQTSSFGGPAFPAIKLLVIFSLFINTTAVSQTTGSSQENNFLSKDITPFKVNVPGDELIKIRNMVQSVELPVEDTNGNWDMGMPVSFARKLRSYWIDKYDWRHFESQINKYQQYQAIVDGLKIHFIYIKGSGKNPMPLLLLHGWPDSPFGFLSVIEKLAHPERFGGREEDGYTLIIPSLPGFGFSDAPPKPISLQTMAGIMDKFMTEKLGINNYVIGGGDFGSITGTWMALSFPDHVKALYQYLVFPRHASSIYGSNTTGKKNPSREEIKFVKDEAATFYMQSAYFHLHNTRPSTTAIAVGTNPFSIATWVIEKYYYWKDTTSNLDEVFSMDDLLNIAMLYIVNKNFKSTVWPYYMLTREANVIPTGIKVKVPTAIASFPDPLNTVPPRSFVAESRGNIIQWTTHDKGGHFPHLLNPDGFVKDLLLLRKNLKP